MTPPAIPPRAPPVYRADGTGTGTIIATLPPVELDNSVAVPFGYVAAEDLRPAPVAILLHLHYVDLAGELIACLRHVPAPADLFVTTDTEAKRAAIMAALAGWDRGHREVRVTPNRGRDIAAKLVGLADVHRRYDLVLHAHGKKTPQWVHGDGWRRYLFQTLAGSADIVRSIRAAFDQDPRLGIVFPQHWDPVRPAVSWGYDFRRALELAGRMGFALTRDQPIDFPSGSMFWARSAALRPLLDLGLTFDDFPAEGFTRGTIAHAIERLFLRICEHAGHTWLRVARPELLADRSGIVSVDRPDALAAFRRKNVYLLGDPALRRRPDWFTGAAAPVPVGAFRFRPDPDPAPRMTLLATGPAPADPRRLGSELDIFLRAAAAAGAGTSIRIVAHAAYRRAAGDLAADHPAIELETAVSGRTDGPMPLGVRPHETLFVTDFGDAISAASLLDCQGGFFGRRGVLVHMVLAWHPRVAADVAFRIASAQAWKRPAATIAVIGSPMIAHNLEAEGLFFSRREVMGPVWNPALDPALAPTDPHPRDRLLLLDWRPSDPDCLAALALAAVEQWLEHDPEEAHGWQLCGIGEAGPDIVLGTGHVLRNLGAPPPPDYPALLCRVRLGVSLTLSVEPCRSALEWAACGVATVVSPRYAMLVRVHNGCRLLPAAGLDIDSIVAAIARACIGNAAARQGPFGSPEAAGFWSIGALDSMAARIVQGAAQPG